MRWIKVVGKRCLNAWFCYLCVRSLTTICPWCLMSADGKGMNRNLKVCYLPRYTGRQAGSMLSERAETILCSHKNSKHANTTMLNPQKNWIVSKKSWKIFTKNEILDVLNYKAIPNGYPLLVDISTFTDRMAVTIWIRTDVPSLAECINSHFIRGATSGSA